MNAVRSFYLFSAVFAALAAPLAVCAADSSSTQVAVAQPPAASNFDKNLHPVAETDGETLFRGVAGDIWSKKENVNAALLSTLMFFASTTGSDDAASAEGWTATDLKRTAELFALTVRNSRSEEELFEGLKTNFRIYRSIGDTQNRAAPGGVKITGYFQPTYKGSRTRGGAYRYPIYKLPENLSDLRKASWVREPTRVELEGWSGFGVAGTTDGSAEVKGARLEPLAFLATRYEAFMLHLQGSGILELENGEKMAVGFAGATNYRFRGITKQWLVDRKVRWTDLGEYFDRNPLELNRYLATNNRYIFFEEKKTPDPQGSLGVPVVAERSIATDKTALPPGAIGVVAFTGGSAAARASLGTPLRNAAEMRAGGESSADIGHTLKFVVDHDTGSAIKGPGRVDLFMGTGPEAGRKASGIFTQGALYYMLAK